ncbi:bifunctional [glutamine synthetase] adenylyltransferase/[glutamine synthetase]-adenylyl-L-tyrosine phosphorylase [Pseudoclavibacter alba]|uniref:Bifunctional [glutamine synthetase] adenylyltransferase/[glutamine synthetase]-adenylyl-L-tyrosine phosphorylase n=1 Tax=Pseudoclavibacter albus TaxID=272241 RepID=A0ABT2HVX6_9MICO|nr:bifunctional [glutamine synthetase] adenylyltransferase/[glutamine synthetase]-adenylyl-L-tyrosine phosphorylase [Pseudoclavibacter alba]MCT2042468.1 bifunctional [glutamine synthetase] adenylyltransferase/[glutamine synthetase]-adenylyl-L-tyrosine phosphorylase [Pseudoclavibacter alba]
MTRRPGERGELIRHGFRSPSEADEALTRVETERGMSRERILAQISRAVADPDQAVQFLARAIDRAPELVASCEDDTLLETVLIVMGASSGLAEFLLRSPESLLAMHDGVAGFDHPGRIVDRITASVREETPGAASRILTGHEARTALRQAWRRELGRIVRTDLASEEPREIVDQVAALMSTLADAVLHAALTVAREELAQIKVGPGRVRDGELDALRFGILAMGKCGAQELNIVSDVDVMFVVDVVDGTEMETARAIDVGSKLATRVMQIINEAGVEPPLWELDANLRPEGKDGALVRTPDSYLKYYERWAKNWEFQALLKARAAAGDLALGNELVERLAPLVWASAGREDFVEQTRAMRERVTDHIPRDELDVQLKLGPGGLRDIEFTVQLLQLVHGQNDETLRVRSTLGAIERLCDGGYIGRDLAERFDVGYRSLRLLEHRLQLRRLRRTHLMPREESELAVLARATRAKNSGELIRTWQRLRIEIRGLHENVFYRPLLSAVASLPEESFYLTNEQAAARLRAIGFQDTKGALTHLAKLIDGVSRGAQIHRHLLPVILLWLGQRGNPDQGLLAYRKLSEQLGDSSWYLRLLRDSNAAAERLTQLLGDSRFFANFLEVHPEAVRWLDSPTHLEPKTPEALRRELERTIRRYDDEAGMRRAIRTVRRREMLRLAIGRFLDLNSVDVTARGLAELSTEILQAGLNAIERLDDLAEVAASERPPRFAIIAMGRYGGMEQSFGSDLDVLYVADPAEDDDAERAMKAAHQLVNRLTKLLDDPRLPIELDAELRPEGKKGPLVRSLAAYTSYYESWSLGWEAQALLRARPVAGDEELGRAFMALADTIRYPAQLDARELVEIRRIKARIEAERLPRGVDPRRHLKLGPGNLSDVEWLVQCLQLQHGAEIPGLRTASTMDALQAAQDAGLITAEEHETLQTAWQLASAIRGAIFLASGKCQDVLPESMVDLEAIARVLGYRHGEGAILEDHCLAVSRRSRKVFEERFYGA